MHNSVVFPFLLSRHAPTVMMFCSRNAKTHNVFFFLSFFFFFMCVSADKTKKKKSEDHVSPIPPKKKNG